MNRRLLALVCTLALLVPALPASAAAEGVGSFIQVWQVEGMVGGDLGGTARKVEGRDEMTMSLEDGAFTGEIRYEDALAVQAASGAVTAQFSSIEVTLTGTSAEGGAAAAGSFAGTATLVTRDARSLDDLRDRSGKEVTYEVSGHWGAKLENGIARGELLYERATPLSQDDPTADYKGAVWFNRLSAETGGGSQSFEVEVAGLAPGTKPRSETSGKTSSQPGGLGALAYVRRGIAGQPGAQAPPVPLALSKQARALKDAAPPGAVKLPANAVAIDVDVPGAYLDAKNRAAGLLGDRGPIGDGAARLAKAWAPAPSAYQANYSEAPLSAEKYPAAIADALSSQTAVPAASDLASAVAQAGSALRAPDADATPFRTWLETVRAVGSLKPLGSVLAATAARAEAVRSASIPRSGAPADAVRVAALAPEPPRAAAVVTSFGREASKDTSGGAGPLLDRAGAPASPVDLTKLPVAGARPSGWLAYRRADGALFWLGAPANRQAVTDGTLRGAGFKLPRLYVVDATDVGRILAVYTPR